ncbi:unnamed protein product [Macrosiphum euphorbiae]|uniref:Uncharacterized protein n=1 Tax=Macrosiphum euphorbiae TaxID=13131 RepID=A0AAV0VWZ8_9HEMI|nr:unnamed protein product [Macrosiphum euphorbiae]
MFLSYSTVPMFSFMILLNLFLLYSPLASATNGKWYDTCQQCKADPCFKQFNRPCLLRNNKFYCFLCHPKNGRQQYYTEDGCQQHCKDSGMLCVCSDSCYVCESKGARSNPASCRKSTAQEYNKCL